MYVLSNLKHLPSTKEFACTSGPTEGPEIVWACWSPGDCSPMTRVVTVLGDDPGSLRSVTAMTHRLDDWEAAEFFAFVSDLCLADNDPANPQTWIDQNISYGGSQLARSADLTLNGTKEDRTLEIAATGLAME